MSSATPPESLVDAALAVEALLVTSDRPLSTEQLADAARAQPGSVLDAADVEAAIASLNADYERTGRSFRIEKVAGGYRLMTLPEFAPVIAAHQKARASTRLSKAAIETLAIIAYRQPVTRAEVEAIRGVACGETIKTLMERRLVTIKGRAEEVGRPMLYGTTKQFLDAFGLSSLKDLPATGELPDGS